MNKISSGNRRALLAALGATALGLAFSPAQAQTVPAGYPASYSATIAAAQKEGKLVVYSTTDSASVEPMLKDFKALYPFIQLEYNDLNSTELYNRFISEAAANASASDFVWSSSMDLQMKLVSDKFALTYDSPEIKSLPTWSVSDKQAFGTTLEPLVFIYNKRLLPADSVPKSHADLATLLAAKPALFKEKVTAYDPEKSGVGFMLMAQDARDSKEFWSFAKELGKAGSKYYTSAGAMIEKVASGEHLIAYNIFGSYALLKQKTDANIGIVYPADYTLGMSRVAFIPAKAKNPNAGKLFLDYVLSHRGQDIMANQSLLNSIRDDVDGIATAKALRKEVGDKLKPIPVDNTLLEDLEQKRRLELLNLWKQNGRAS